MFKHQPNFRAPGDQFEHHVSHQFPFAAALSVSWRGKDKKLEDQAVAIDALVVREERWQEEELLAAQENRKPRHPGPIFSLKKFVQEFSRDQENWQCGMTNTSFVTENDVFISLKEMSSLDQEIGEEGEGFQLHDVITAPVLEPLPRSRTQVLDVGFEAVLDLIRDGGDEMIESLLFSIQGKKVTPRRMRQIIAGFAEKLGQGDLFVGGV